MSKALIICFVCIFFLLFQACTGGGETKETGGTKQTAQDGKLDELRSKIVETALRYEGTKLFSNVMVGGKNFKFDCIGAVSAIFYSLGIDLTKDFHKYQGNGVSRLYYTLEAKELLYQGTFPLPGDIIFWDHTWDRNNNQLFGDDPLTHAGIIIKADPETGEIHYLHANYYKNALTINVLNLHKPDVYKDDEGNIINDIIFSTTSWTKNEPKKLGGQLYKDSGYVTEEF